MSKSIESLKISHIQLLVIEILYDFYILNSLNIVKNLVELHDGKITASNRPNNEGAIMEISFPSM